MAEEEIVQTEEQVEIIDTDNENVNNVSEENIKKEEIEENIENGEPTEIVEDAVAVAVVTEEPEKKEKKAEKVAEPENAASAANKIERNLRKQRVGVVVSNRMNKTVVVKIEERVQHPKYHKILKRSIKLKAHDEKNECDIGDKILVMETRPLSKDKKWRLVEILEKVK